MRRYIGAVTLVMALVLLSPIGQAFSAAAGGETLRLDLTKLYAFQVVFSGGTVRLRDGLEVGVYSLTPSGTIWFLMREPAVPARESVAVDKDGLPFISVYADANCRVEEVAVVKSIFTVHDIVRTGITLRAYAVDMNGGRHELDETVMPRREAEQLFALGEEKYAEAKKALGLARFCPTRDATLALKTAPISRLHLWSKDDRFNYTVFLQRQNYGPYEDLSIPGEDGIAALRVQLQIGRAEFRVVKNVPVGKDTIRQTFVAIEKLNPRAETWESGGRILTLAEGGGEKTFTLTLMERRALVREGFAALDAARSYFGVKGLTYLSNIKAP